MFIQQSILLFEIRHEMPEITFHAFVDEMRIDFRVIRQLLKGKRTIHFPRVHDAISNCVFGAAHGAFHAHGAPARFEAELSVFLLIDGARGARFQAKEATRALVFLRTDQGSVDFGGDPLDAEEEGKNLLVEMIRNPLPFPFQDVADEEFG